MLQYPINFYPDGHTIDPDGGLAQRTVSFTFKGDVLQSVHYKIYNYDTEELVYSTFDPFLTNAEYNESTISNQNILSNLSAPSYGRGGRYVLQCLLTQGQSNYLLCDRFVLRGELVEDYDHLNDTVNMMIEDKINLIYEWNVNAQGIHTPVVENIEGVNRTLGIIKMRIGNEEHTILSYNYNTGEIVLDYRFANDYPKGTPYQLYSNYLITQQYYFETMSTPSFSSLQAKWAGDGVSTNMVGVEFTADYPLTAYDYLRYYTIALEKQSGNGYKRIYETEKIYSQKIQHTFYDDYDVDNENFDIGNSQTRKYRFVLKGVLQNGMTISAQLESTAPERVNERPISRLQVQQINTDDYHNAVKITWAYSAGTFSYTGGVRIYRYDMNANDVIHDRVQLVSAYADDAEFIDTTVSTHGTYRYVLIPFLRVGTDVGTSYTPLVSDEITTDMYGYTITELIKRSELNGKETYGIGESWHLRADVEDTTITQNTDKALHVGYGKYSSVTHTATNYMSSTFTGAIVQANCGGEVKWRDDIDLVKAWRDFITRDCIYLLRSQKGDVWVVNIIENPTTSYEEKYRPISTSVSFTWAECASVDDIMVVSGNVW